MYENGSGFVLLLRASDRVEAGSKRQGVIFGWSDT